MVQGEVRGSPVMRDFVLLEDFICWTTFPPTTTWKPETQSWSRGLHAIKTPSTPTLRVTLKSEGLGMQPVPSEFLQVLLLKKGVEFDEHEPAGRHFGSVFEGVDVLRGVGCCKTFLLESAALGERLLGVGSHERESLFWSDEIIMKEDGGSLISKVEFKFDCSFWDATCSLNSGEAKQATDDRTGAQPVWK